MRSITISRVEYRRFLTGLKERIRAAHGSAVRAVNRQLIELYWDLGQSIVEKQEALGWGEAVVESLSRDLQKEFAGARGFSADNLWRMRQFYAVYHGREFLEQAVPERRRPRPRPKLGPSRGPFLEQAVPEMAGGSAMSGRPRNERQLVELLREVPWGHHIEILKKTDTVAARLYYLRATVRFGWSRNVLLNQIKAEAYERSLTQRKAHNFPAALPEHLAEQAEEALKSSYNLEFLGIARAVKERQVEDRLIERVQHFILELGYGFCFIDRQHRLTLGRKEYFLDLLFYHRFLKALVAVELKVGAFAPEYAGKMDFYLNVLNEKERAPGDNPSIGIVLCAEKDDLEVEFALKTKSNPIGVAEYRLQSKLPPELKGKLPSPRQLTEAIRAVLPGKPKK